ncbi:MAG: VWA domain-containing protein [Luteococcus sp.]|uniref:vWA domain-containing protein n=1 Tax=Luteococcus sp. TaxID=1969402 RepID=UPI0026496867|nr:VWA domain-containing protein [Luteococcus sp.]MDN5563922.1 VWA domain-containing protein [Luteococcus sp.]
MNTTSTLTALAVLAALGSAATMPGPARADEGDQAGTMMLVLDSSGSMKEPAQGGMTKIDAAKKSLTSLMGGLPVDTRVGLRVFGATVENKGDDGACTDSQLVVPAGTDNRAALRAAVSSYKPYGETPIGFALTEAAKDLGDKGKRSIVLVSDGVATCEPDPCEAAKQVAAKGVDVTIDVVGMSVDDAARKQLQCIATAGKGKYYDVKNADQLTTALEQTKKHTATPAQLEGKPVKGALVSTEASTIQAGDWTDTVGPKGGKDATKYYRVQRTIPGSTLAVSAIYQRGYGIDDDLGVNLLGADGRHCTVGSAYGVKGTFASATAVTPAGKEDCEGDDLVLELSHDEHTSAKQAHAVQLKVTEVPPATNIASLPESPEEGFAKAPVIGRSTPLEGGKSLASATTIESGKTYSGTIAGNDVKTFKVPVGNGQRLAAALRFPKVSDQLAAPFKDLDIDHSWDATITVLGPDGARINRDGTLYAGTIDADAEVGSATVAPHNLTKDLPKDWLAGYYTIVIGLEGPAGKKTPAVPFAFATDVTGSTTTAPEYASEGLAPSPSASPDGGESTSQEPSASASEPASVQPSPTQEAPTTEGSSALPVALGVGGLALVAGGVALALRNRRR